MVLLGVAVTTFPVPGIPSLSEMDKATASAPRVIVECRTTWVGDIPSETCSWTLRLDDGKELFWPGAKAKESSGQVGGYLRANGPITVRFWNGTLYQIELHDGQVYLDYGDVYDSEWMKQWIGVILGFLVAAMSILCLGGVLLVAVFGWPRMWIGVIGLALFAAPAPGYCWTSPADHTRALRP